MLKQAMKKNIRENNKLHIYFVDLEKAFDRIKINYVGTSLERKSLEKNEERRNLYENQHAQDKNDDGINEKQNTKDIT